MTQETPFQNPQIPYTPPPGLRRTDQASIGGGRGSGLQQDEASVGLQHARSEERGENVWRLRGVLLQRVHQIPRPGLYVLEHFQLPVIWGRILPRRRNRMRYNDGSISEIVDDWTITRERGNPSEFWTGVTTFTIGPEKSSVQVPDYHTEDFWLKEAHTWIRAHVVPRCARYTPLGASHGSTHPEQLLDVRRSTCYLPNGEEAILEDNWKVVGR